MLSDHERRVHAAQWCKMEATLFRLHADRCGIGRVAEAIRAIGMAEMLEAVGRHASEGLPPERAPQPETIDLEPLEALLRASGVIR